MNTNKPNNTIDIFRASMVVDYVAGTLGDEDRITFENLLSESPALQRAVDSEQELRNALIDLEHQDSADHPVSNEDVGKLFAKLDELEQETAMEEAAMSRTQTSSGHRSWYAIAGVAASIAFVTVMFVNFQTIENNSNFALLSDDPAAPQVDFNQLVSEQKVVQVWLANELSTNDLSEVFAKHQLTPISRAGQAWIVTSATVLSKQHLQDLEALEVFSKLSLISYNTPLEDSQN